MAMPQPPRAPQPPPASHTATTGTPALPSLDSLPSSSTSTVASTTVTPFTLAKLTKMPAEKQHKVTGRLCSLRPFSIVEDTYFRAFLSKLNTSYKVPSRGEVSERFLPKMYEAALLNLKTELQEVEYAALTGDGWTSRVADHYLTLTVHYMKDWEMKVRVLQTLKAEVSQTGDNIAAEIGQCLEDFSLKGKVEVMATDNAKAMVNATTNFCWSNEEDGWLPYTREREVTSP
ncbi:hypothetical protein KUCAC02_018190 [Chaenocephalus aceratus]|uniref:Uncharacterized protein n=1 Tax=Chaenocephalus aceratus TaxID=36190 RepID=A0ACB9W8G0_CHAAC|nr:hypothetical protein KUCAC02_018190 [Chaenocephalus aceratus]